MNLPGTWRTSVLGSCLHVARCLDTDLPLADPRAADSLRSHAELVAFELSGGGRLAADEWRVAVALAANDPTPEEFAARAVAVAPAGRRLDVPRLGAAVAALRERVLEFLPRLSAELPLRVGPLREQWEARGPGLLSQAARITGIPLRSLAADALVLHPWLGGFGEAYGETAAPAESESSDGAKNEANGEADERPVPALTFAPPDEDSAADELSPGEAFVAPSAGAVGIEGVLVNPLSRLPEAVRLGWLFLRLAVDDVLSDVQVGGRADFLAAVTLAPIVAAGQYVELVPSEDAMRAEAFAQWLPGRVPAELQRRLLDQEIAPGMDWLDEAAEFAAAWSFGK